jgi:hypothetical protein
MTVAVVIHQKGGPYGRKFRSAFPARAKCAFVIRPSG